MDKAQNKFLSVVYQLYTIAENGEKNLEEQTGDERPFEFITGFGIALDRFEQELLNVEKGAAFDFCLKPEEAFGKYEPQGVNTLKRELFMVNGKFDSENIYEGSIITLTDNEDHRFMAKVIKIDDKGVTVDTNHPLAGKTLNFVGKVIESREATEEEVQHLIKKLTGGCGGCGGCGGHHGEGEGCGEGCDEGCEGGGCGHCHH